MYVRNIYNPNYIEDVDPLLFYENRDKFAAWQPLSTEESKAEDVYRKKVQPHEKLMAARSFASGLTAGLTEIGLNNEDKMLLGKYKQRSSVGQALGFLGSAAGIVATGGIAGAAVRGAAVGLGAARAGLAARGAAFAGDVAGMTAFTGTQEVQRQRLQNLVGKGKYVTEQTGLEIYTREGISNAVFMGVFSGLGAGYRAGKRRLQGKAQDLSKGTRQTAKQKDLEREFKLKTFGVDEKNLAQAIPKIAARFAKDDARIGAGKAIEKELTDVMREALRKKGKETTLVDLENALKRHLESSGKALREIRGTAQKALTEKGQPVMKAADKTYDKIVNASKKVGPATGKINNIKTAYEKNLFKVQEVVYQGRKQKVRLIDKNFLFNLQKTKDYVSSLISKTKSANKKAIGKLKQVQGWLLELEKDVLKGLGGKHRGRYRAITEKYSKLRAIENSLARRMREAREMGFGEKGARHSIWASIMGLGKVTAPFVGAGLVGLTYGPFAYILASVLAGAWTLGKRHTVQRGWQMSIYPDIYQRANRYIRGGSAVPDVISRNIDHTVRRRSQFIDNLQKGIKKIPKGTFKRNIIKEVNEWTREEQVDFLEGIRDESAAAFQDPQVLNNIAFGSSELLSQAGGSSFAPQVIMDTIQGLRDIVESFPPDRLVPRADDLSAEKNLWSDKQIKIQLKRLEAFFEPDDVIEEMITGDRDINIDQIQYLAKYHPYYFNALRQWMMIGLNNGNLKLNRREKTRYSYIFSLPIRTSAHPALLSITEQTAGLALARQAQQKEQIRKNLNVERKADSLKTAAERSLLNEERV